MKYYYVFCKSYHIIELVKELKKTVKPMHHRYVFYIIEKEEASIFLLKEIG